MLMFRGCRSDREVTLLGGFTVLRLAREIHLFTLCCHTALILEWKSGFRNTFQKPLSLYQNYMSLSSKSGFPGGSAGKNPPANARDTGSIPRSGRSPGGWNGNPLQYPCLGNPMDRGAWWATVLVGSQRVGHDWACVCTHTHTHTHTHSSKGQIPESHLTPSIRHFVLILPFNNCNYQS